MAIKQPPSDIENKFTQWLDQKINSNAINPIERHMLNDVARLLQTPAMRIHQNWIMVPREPDDCQIDAAMEIVNPDVINRIDLMIFYEEMVNTAPEQPLLPSVEEIINTSELKPSISVHVENMDSFTISSDNGYRYYVIRDLATGRSDKFTIIQSYPDHNNASIIGREIPLKDCYDFVLRHVMEEKEIEV